MQQYLFLRKCQDGDIDAIKKNTDKLYKDSSIIYEFGCYIRFSMKKCNNSIKPIQYIIMSKKKRTIEFLLRENLILKEYYPEVIKYYPDLIEKIEDKLYGTNFYQKLHNCKFNLMELAIIEEEKKLIQLIYKFGYNPYVKIDGINCVEFAIMKKKYNILDFLLNNFYDLNYIDGSGNTVMDYIVKHRCALPKELIYLLKLKLRKEIAIDAINDKKYRYSIMNMCDIEFLFPQYLAYWSNKYTKIFRPLVDYLSFPYLENAYQILDNMIKNIDSIDEKFIFKIINKGIFYYSERNFYLLKLFISNNFIIGLEEIVEGSNEGDEGDKEDEENEEEDEESGEEDEENDEDEKGEDESDSEDSDSGIIYRRNNELIKEYRVIFKNNIKKKILSDKEIEKIYSDYLWKKKKLLYIAIMKPDNDASPFGRLYPDLIKLICKWIK